ncbi:hypothetical protein ACN38_g3756, partial [Penicillium nordicum]
NLL